MRGLIIKGVGGRYDVKTKNGIVNCSIRGIFRKDSIKPMIGDNVRITLNEDGTGHIEEIFERSVELVRPPVANVTMIILVASVMSPETNLMLLDRMIINSEEQGLKVAICINKIGLNRDVSEELRKIYTLSGYEVFLTDCEEKTGIEELKNALNGNIVIFSGASGVGKSSLINLLLGRDVFEVGSVSKKTDRGRHTTRHAELVRLNEDTLICDTPGYTSIDNGAIEAVDLKSYFIEFEKFLPCKYNDCAHIKEPDCKVMEAYENGEIAKSRYENYRYIYEELKNLRRY